MAMDDQQSGLGTFSSFMTEICGLVLYLILPVGDERLICVAIFTRYVHIIRVR